MEWQFLAHFGLPGSPRETAAFGGTADIIWESRNRPFL